MNIEDTESAAVAPAGTARRLVRYLAIGIALALSGGLTLVHAMGRSDDYGVLGEWYVMTPVTVGVLLAGWLVEKAFLWSGR
ncbi:MAG TPA: hypothetical protein VN408_33590 [Actinoplanes sp.]|nr:hypothetical protein [Actinoplanes sp.]